MGRRTATRASSCGSCAWPRRSRAARPHWSGKIAGGLRALAAGERSLRRERRGRDDLAFRNVLRQVNARLGRDDRVEHPTLNEDILPGRQRQGQVPAQEADRQATHPRRPRRTRAARTKKPCRPGTTSFTPTGSRTSPIPTMRRSSTGRRVAGPRSRSEDRGYA